MKKVAFFGGTGMLGKPVLKEFIKNGYQVTALARNIEKAVELFPEKINWIEGDLSQNDKVEETIVGADIIYANLSVKTDSRENDFQPEREGINAILKSGKWNNVSRIAYMSSIVKSYEGMNGFHWWAFDLKHHAVEKIKRSGIPYIIFNPSSFMENFSEGGYIEDIKIITVGTSKYPNWLIAADDFAKMAVKAIGTLDIDINKEYTIQGPEGFTLNSAASFMIQNQPHLKSSHIPLSLVKMLGIFNRKYNNTAKIVEAINNYPETFASEEVWKELGTPKTTFKDFIQSKIKAKQNIEQEVGK